MKKINESRANDKTLARIEISFDVKRFPIQFQFARVKVFTTFPRDGMSS